MTTGKAIALTIRTFVGRVMSLLFNTLSRLSLLSCQDHLTCLLRNLHAGQKATVRTLYGTTDWFQIEKGLQQGRLVSPCLFNLHAEHIMRTVGLDELQAGTKIGGRNINYLVQDRERSTTGLSPVTLFNLHAEHIMRNAGLDELRAGIKIGGRNINNLRCADDTTLMAESEEELKSLLMKVKEESERAGLKLN